MRKTIVPITIGLLCTSFTMIGVSPDLHDSARPVKKFRAAITEKNIATTVSENIYNNINLQQAGLSKEAFDFAWKGYQNLLKHNKIQRQGFLSICDFSQPSSKKRLYVIDLSTSKLVINTYVAHGKNSGGEYASRFSNKPESFQSSLGFYITSETYIGAHGLSLRVKGVDPGYNDKAYARSIVIHGAAYVDEARAKQGVFMGRSFGCPAVPQKESAEIIHTIKNGTCLFIYHPGKNYLLGSKILNG